MSTYEGFNSSVSIALTVYFQNKEKAIHTYRRREEKREVRLAGEVA